MNAEHRSTNTKMNESLQMVLSLSKIVDLPWNLYIFCCLVTIKVLCCVKFLCVDSFSCRVFCFDSLILSQKFVKKVGSECFCNSLKSDERKFANNQWKQENEKTRITIALILTNWWANASRRNYFSHRVTSKCGNTFLPFWSLVL